MSCKRKGTGWWRQGSFTVEAALLVPFLILLVFVMLCLGFYQHDRSVLTSCAEELAGKGAARKYETEEHLRAWLEMEAVELAEERLLVLQLEEASAVVTSRNVTVTYTGSTPLFGGLRTTEQESAVRLNPVRFIRGCRELGKAAKKL